MRFGFGIVVASIFVAGASYAIPLDASSDAQGTSTATVLVWVRDSRAAPVPGLTADDFIVTENGIRNRVLAVRGLASANYGARSIPSANPAAPGPESGKAPQEAAQFSNRTESSQVPTEVLLIISPMAPRGRRDTLRDAVRLLKRPLVPEWKFGLVDDEGTFVPFGRTAEQTQDYLEALVRRVSALQYNLWFGDKWSPKAARAIDELAALPGRHVVVFLSDYDSKSQESVDQNPTLLRVGPDAFIRNAVRAQAAMYTVQAEGPAVAVPFGSAASLNQYSGSGQDVANAMVQDIVALGALRSDLLQAADETGGRPADDLEDAFKHISADAAGYYLVSFETQPNFGESSLRPFSIASRLPHLTIRGPRFYLAPHGALAGPLPAEMKAALADPVKRSGLNVVAQAWLFPNQGSVHWAAFGADVRFEGGAPPAGSRVKIHAELVNDSIGGVAETWYEEREWPAAGMAPTLHWQREAYLYPGSYVLRVTAMDMFSGRISEGRDEFIARPGNAPAFRFSAIVLADACLPESEQSAMRHNMFDPLGWDGCKLAPTAGGHFRSSQNPLLLVRVYPPGPKVTEIVKKQWKAYAVVDDAEDKAVEMQISAAEVRGLTVAGRLPLARLNLAPGVHDLKVLLKIPARGSDVQMLPLHTELVIEP